MLNFNNRKRSKIKGYDPGDAIFKKNKQIKINTKPFLKKKVLLRIMTPQ